MGGDGKEGRVMGKDKGRLGASEREWVGEGGGGEMGRSAGFGEGGRAMWRESEGWMKMGMERRWCAHAEAAAATVGVDLGLGRDLHRRETDRHLR